MNRSREYAQRLMQRARDDRYAMVRLAEDPQSPPWTIAFHAQQAVEKAIKAVLSAGSIEYPYTHDLERLLELVAASGRSLPPDRRELPTLTPFGATLRYEETAPPPAATPVDRAWAVAAVRRTIDWAEMLLGREAQAGP